MKADSPLALAIERLTAPEVSAENSLLIVRCSKFATFELPSVWNQEQELTIGSMRIWIYRKSSLTET